MIEEAAMAKSWIGQRLQAMSGLVFTTIIAALTPSHADAQAQLQAGVLVCNGEGGWGAIITSRKRFDCTFSASSGEVREQYFGLITKVGLDVGVSGQTTLTWLVFGPAESVGANYAVGALAGSYTGIGAEAALGVGIGANALVGGGASSFALQPVSVQVQTGFSIAAGVETFELQFFDVLN